MKFKQIKYLKLKPKGLFCKYKGELKETCLAKNGKKVDMLDWELTQGEYYLKARMKTIKMAKGWKKRHQRYLKFS